VDYEFVCLHSRPHMSGNNHNKLRCHFDMDATKKKLYMHHCNIQLRITTQPSVTRFSYLIQFVGQLLHDHEILWIVL
jgi:hypothetical protein